MVSTLTGLADPTTLPPIGNSLNTPFTVNTTIHEQVLMHADLGTGYWLIRRPEAQWLTGLAATLELHYTTALDNADIITFPQDTSADPNTAKKFGVTLPTTFTGGNGNGTGVGNGVLGVPAPSQVGNLRNRVDFLDLTVGTTFEIANQLTVATGVTFPMQGGDNKTFDWEFQLQLNYYFGRSNR